MNYLNSFDTPCESFFLFAQVLFIVPLPGSLVASDQDDLTFTPLFPHPTLVILTSERVC